MKALATALFATVIATSAAATGSASSAGFDRARRAMPSTITVAVDGLSCMSSMGSGTFAVRSWSWGAANESPSIGSGGGAGRATVSNLTIKKAFDACSASLFGSVTTGRFYPRVTLTQRDSGGNLVATVELSTALVTSWAVGSTVRDAAPDESVSFSYREVCVTSLDSPRQCFDTRG